MFHFLLLFELSNGMLKMCMVFSQTTLYFIVILKGLISMHSDITNLTRAT